MKLYSKPIQNRNKNKTLIPPHADYFAQLIFICKLT